MPFYSQPSHRALVLPWALDSRVDAKIQNLNPTFRQLLEDLFLSDYTFEEIWGILQDEPACPIRDWPDGVGPNTAPLADGVSLGFAIPIPGPAFTPAPARTPAPTPAPAPVTAGGAGAEEGKMGEACMAQELDYLWGGIVTWISTIPFRNHPANNCAQPEIKVVIQCKLKQLNPLQIERWLYECCTPHSQLQQSYTLSFWKVKMVLRVKTSIWPRKPPVMGTSGKAKSTCYLYKLYTEWLTRPIVFPRV